MGDASLTEGKPSEKILLLLIIAFLSFFTLQATLAVSQSGDQQITTFYRLLIIVMLTLLAVSVYVLVKMLI